MQRDRHDAISTRPGKDPAKGLSHGKPNPPVAPVLEREDKIPETAFVETSRPEKKGKGGRCDSMRKRRIEKGKEAGDACRHSYCPAQRAADRPEKIEEEVRQSFRNIQLAS